MKWSISTIPLVVAMTLCGCATGQDVYIGTDIVQVIPHEKAVAYLQKSVRNSHTGYECTVSATGIVFPRRGEMPDYGEMPFEQLRAHTVWASWPSPSGSTGFVLLVEGVTGLLSGDRCILFVHPDPGPLTQPSPNKGMSTALEAIVSLGASYSKPSSTTVPGLRVFMPIGL